MALLPTDRTKFIPQIGTTIWKHIPPQSQLGISNQVNHLNGWIITSVLRHHLNLLLSLISAVIVILPAKTCEWAPPTDGSAQRVDSLLWRTDWLPEMNNGFLKCAVTLDSRDLQVCGGNRLCTQVEWHMKQSGSSRTWTNSRFYKLWTQNWSFE